MSSYSCVFFGKIENIGELATLSLRLECDKLSVQKFNVRNCGDVVNVFKKKNIKREHLQIA